MPVRELWFGSIRPFIRQHVEVLVWLPVTLLLLAGGWYVTWRMGLAVIEVGPILMDMVVKAGGALVILWIAWLAKKVYWDDLTDRDERLLKSVLGDPQSDAGRAKWMLVFDRVQYVVMVLLVSLAWSVAQARTPEAECVRDLIVRWEVGSQQQYVRRYQNPIWPGGASGVTWGLGYDGGHQPRAVIREDWWMHPERERLSTTAGIVGEAARVALPRYRDIVVQWPDAARVFDERSAPRYARQARQAYGEGFDRAPVGVRCALVSETYNRGPGMAGERRRERRVIRDVCLAANPVDSRCVAEQLEASCRVWANDPVNGRGLCARRLDEARVARGRT